MQLFQGLIQTHKSTVAVFAENAEYSQLTWYKPVLKLNIKSSIIT